MSSLLKGWFRACELPVPARRGGGLELLLLLTTDSHVVPDAILPIDVQKRIYEKCKDQTESIKPPQAFIEELSNLPPYVRSPCHIN